MNEDAKFWINTHQNVNDLEYEVWYVSDGNYRHIICAFDSMITAEEWIYNRKQGINSNSIYELIINKKDRCKNG